MRNHVIWETIFIVSNDDLYHLWFLFLKSNSIRQSQSAGQRPVRFVYVDTNQLDLDHEFKLTTVQLPNVCNPGETNYKLKPLKNPSQDMEVILVQLFYSDHKVRHWKG